ncbi:MAG TPA: aromatic aminobenezylarsenical efflux permease ArsG family transporter [Tenuifilaceae bacterium]|nr:aromatic aminobenezylarsenical efflux permease ArsG family transporter [Tenuifilaceae bacterium]
MEEFLNNLYSASSAPIWSALLLGLMTAISPCPLATNITAMGFVSKDIENKNRVFINGLIYTVGRAFSYTLLAFILLIGADQLKLSLLFQKYGEKILGPLLIIIGLFMLGILSLNFLKLGSWSSKLKNKEKHSYADVFLLGTVFALAFCPYSGVLYFGMLIPMTIQSSWGLALPIVFAIATGIPVIVFAWLLAYTVSGVGKFYNKIKLFELWFRRVVAVIFIGIGVYYLIIAWI